MSIDTKNILRQIGFTDSEILIYLAAIQYGPMTVIELAKHSGLTRQMVYTLLPRLEKESLMKEVRSDSKRLFAATDPKLLEDRVNMIARDVRYVIPQLQMMHSENAMLPIMTVYDNPLSIRELYRRFMKEAVPEEDVRLWVTNKVWVSMDADYLRTFVHFKNKHRIRDLIIAPDTKESRSYAKEMFQPYSEYRFLKDHWNTNAEKWIWRDIIVYLTISDEATNLIVVESPALAAIERAGFDAVWRSLPKGRKSM